MSNGDSIFTERLKFCEVNDKVGRFLFLVFLILSFKCRSGYNWHFDLNRILRPC